MRIHTPTCPGSRKHARTRTDKYVVRIAFPLQQSWQATINCSLLQPVQTGFENQFPVQWIPMRLISISCRGSEWVESYLNFPIPVRTKTLPSYLRSTSIKGGTHTRGIHNFFHFILHGQRQLLATHLTDWGETQQTYPWIADITIDILTGNFLNTNQKCHHFSHPAW